MKYQIDIYELEYGASPFSVPIFNKTIYVDTYDIDAYVGSMSDGGGFSYEKNQYDHIREFGKWTHTSQLGALTVSEYKEPDFIEHQKPEL